jgi:nanoRNase/pAp phosphatase (c-di-AMP/oligoRNAs hydrolase)
MSDALQRLLDLELGEGEMLVLTHDNPDPDSLASAAGMKLLLERKMGVSTTVAYSGIIGRAENRAMVKLLHMNLKHVSDLSLDDFRYVAIIDAQPHTGNSVLPPDRFPDIVVDHHPLREQTKKARFVDVREKLGASATIVTQYLRKAGVPIPRDLATGLLYGIRSETQDLGREAAEEDFDAYVYLFHLADTQKLAAISMPSLEPMYFTQLAHALDAMKMSDHVTIAHLESVMDPDSVPELADYTVRMEGIMWSLVTGQYERNIYLSIRSNDPAANAGEMMIQLLEGLGRGGGHGMRGGGKIDLTKVSGSLESIQQSLADRFLELTGYPGEELIPLRLHPRGQIKPAKSNA